MSHNIDFKRCNKHETLVLLPYLDVFTPLVVVAAPQPTPEHT